MSHDSQKRLQTLTAQLAQKDHQRVKPPQAYAQMTPRQQRQFDQRQLHRIAVIDAMQESGAGLLADQTLRRLAVPLTQKYMAQGTASLPMHFSISEAFLRYAAADDLLLLRPEHDHLISFADFLDYVTGDAAAGLSLDSARGLNEGEIYHYSMRDDPHETLFSAEDGARYGVAAISMVRRGNDLVVAIVAGEENVSTDFGPDGTLMRGMSDAEATKKINEARRVPLPGYPDLYTTIAITRFDLTRAVLDTRYLIVDYGSILDIASDDFPDYLAEAMAGRNDADRIDVEQAIANNARSLHLRSVLFEIARACVLLPDYLNYRIAYLEYDRRPTQLADQLRRSLRKRKEMDQVDMAQKVLFRRVAAIRPIPATPPVLHNQERAAPTASVSVTGFWRYFRNPEWQGHDPAGQPVSGRTWVHSHTRWKDLPPPAGPVVRVKDDVSGARARVEDAMRKGIIEPLPE